MQYPEENSYYNHDVDNCYGWLIQFSDGNRLDLHVCTLSHVLKEIEGDRLCRILLDKDKCLPNMPEATDKDYWVKKPTEYNFLIHVMNFGGVLIMWQRDYGVKKYHM